MVVIQGVEAMLEYYLDDQNIDFYRTLVPLTLHHQGIAEKSVRTGLAWAKTEGLNISTRCSYVVNFLRRHLKLHRLMPPIADAHVQQAADFFLFGNCSAPWS